MDTQGTFDSQSTTKESTTIFSLSMLTSSVQIYNVMSNISENDLQHLQFFTEYGRLAQKANGTKAFQKLLFLVRDWDRPQNFVFGSRGGKALIDSRLNIEEKQATELKTLRQKILSSFSVIDGFLLPHPGKKVTRDESFDGRLADIDEEFRENLQELVASVLAPENLLVKLANGKILSCEHLMTFFKAYVEVFKGSDLPEPLTALLATANATNVAAVDKAKRHYMFEMKNRPRRSLDELREFHRVKLAEAKKVFNDFPKLDGGAISLTSMNDLTKDLEELFNHFIKDAEETIKKEQEEEAKRERERDEERKREEQRERERILEKQNAEAREAEMQREREKMNKKQKETEQERDREKERAEKSEREKEEMSKKLADLAKNLEDAIKERESTSTWRDVLDATELAADLLGAGFMPGSRGGNPFLFRRLARRVLNNPRFSFE
ncbi:atlastin-1-like [Rhipicephalus sanguineus]|uniref:atlastin-1-like n=1 Tax=Rhipicephalus sanguineus TaxID=34632 RepID=UPI0020C46E00|nr:atlastin-1-like [Rhipicephalus sanguineus]